MLVEWLKIHRLQLIKFQKTQKERSSVVADEKMDTLIRRNMILQESFLGT